MQGADRVSAPPTTSDTDAVHDDAPDPPWWRRDPLIALEVGVVGLLVVLVWRLQWIADDGYIYLTHVQNWTANGAGPNLNVGERVEGYTSIAWLVLLSLGDVVRPDRLVSLEQMTVLVGLALTTVAAAMWIAIERVAIGVTRDESTPPGDGVRAVLNVPLVLFASSYVVRSYATSGLETSLILVLVTAVVWVVWTSRRSLVALAALAGCAPLVRPELGLVSIGLVALLVGEWRSRPADDRPGPRGTVALALLVVLPLLVSELARIAYYGQLLPNTYYAKTGTSHGWSQGWTYLRDAAGPHRWWWIVAAAVVVSVAPPVLRLRRAGRFDVSAPDRRRWFLLGFAIVMALASMRNGGDFMHGRTLLPAFVFLLGSLSGAASVALGRVDRPAWRAPVAVAATVALLVVQLPLTSRQHATGDLIIGDIADELRFYEQRDPNAHRFTGANDDPLSTMGRDAAALADRLDTEIGLAVGALGMTSYFAQRDGAAVYLYDVAGLTRPDVARVEPDVDTRVGHARRATEPMVVLDPRVDFTSLSFEGYDEAFTVPVGTSEFVLVSFDLIDPLLEAGLIDRSVVDRMTGYLAERLDADDVDPDLVQLLVWRPFPDQTIADRVDALRASLPPSAWGEWADATADERALLTAADCGGIVDCFRRAFDAHRAGPIEFLPPGALAPPG